MEDELSARKAIAKILQTRGFAVSEAGTVSEALAAMPAGPDWILLDLMLPDGCGINVLRRAQSQRNPARICVISGCGAEMLQEARAAGADHCFAKPIDLPELMKLLAA